MDMGAMDSISVKKPDPYDKIAVILVLFFFCLLSAITAAVPNNSGYLSGNNGTDPEQLNLNNGDAAWVIVASALVLLMTPGAAFFYGGMVDHKNVISTMYQSFVTMGIVSILWVIVGFSLAFGKDANGSGIMGYPKTYFMYNDVGGNPEPTLAPTIPLTIFSMFQLMFAIITAALISGSLAERVNFNSWMLFVCIWHILVYCPLAHMAFHPDGILRKYGLLDFAGGTVVEMASGYASLAGASFLGPRKNVHIGNPNSNIPFTLLGTAFFWFGWLGFNAGSALNAGPLACHTFATTNTAAAAAMITWIFLDKLTGRLPSVIGACNGCVVGLVAITPACGFVTVGSSMVIGVIGCIVCYFMGVYFNERTGIDDSLDVFTVHGVGGTVGIICTGIFCSNNVNPSAPNGLIYGQGLTLGKHLAIIVVIIPCILISSYACFYLVNLVIPLRVSALEEEHGLDISMHNERFSGHNYKENQLKAKDDEESQRSRVDDIPKRL
jgi:Amt family ammonium transporter